MLINSFSKLSRVFNRRQLFYLARRFSSAAQPSDPYYILGVDRSTEFAQIKKIFYQLANEYHPDKNTSPDAARQFILIKEAFQAIRQQRGFSVAQNLQRSATSASQKSRRPNAEQFEEDWQADSGSSAAKERDYRMEKEKVPEGQQYDHFRTSFTTINDINDVKIRVEEGQMKDAAERFGLDKLRTKNKVLADGGYAFIFIIIIGLGVFFLAVNQIYSKNEEQSNKARLLALMQMQSRNDVRGNDDVTVQQMRLLEEDPEYQRYKLAREQSRVKSSAKAGLQSQDKIVSSDDVKAVM